MDVVPVSKLKELPGRELGPSGWIEIDQSRIDAFAEATGDRQFIHVDPEAAAQTPFGSTIAHGFLSLSLVVPLMAEIGVMPESAVMAINYGLNKLRFPAPVPVGSRVRLAAVVADVESRSGGGFLITNEITVEIEGSDRPALVAEMLTLWFVAP